ncbi:DUF5753 domain-containing protein [Micromonospora sp. LOL_023]|uniref:DUF5753 domain-containing protein n=1 Tax=Micromonospora sp. LOL_023 TaxID=3345418 RepID=UPI003A8C24B4
MSRWTSLRICWGGTHPLLGEHAPIWLRSFVEHEQQAMLLRAFQPLAIAGLLQTEAYARTIMTGYGLRGDELEAALNTRLVRQEVLRRSPDPCQLVAVIDEWVLHRDVGGPDVMREQLEAIVSASELPSVRVHIIPTSAGAYAEAQAVVTSRPTRWQVGHQ